MVAIRYINKGERTGQERCVRVAEATDPKQEVSDCGPCRTFYWVRSDPFDDFDYTVVKAKRWAERQKLDAVYVVRSDTP